MAKLICGRADAIPWKGQLIKTVKERKKNVATERLAVYGKLTTRPPYILSDRVQNLKSVVLGLPPLFLSKQEMIPTARKNNRRTKCRHFLK